MRHLPDCIDAANRWGFAERQDACARGRVPLVSAPVRLVAKPSPDLVMRYRYPAGFQHSQKFWLVWHNPSCFAMSLKLVVTPYRLPHVRHELPCTFRGHTPLHCSRITTFWRVGNFNCQFHSSPPVRMAELPFCRQRLAIVPFFRNTPAKTSRRNDLP